MIEAGAQQQQERVPGQYLLATFSTLQCNQFLHMRVTHFMLLQLSHLFSIIHGHADPVKNAATSMAARKKSIACILLLLLLGENAQFSLPLGDILLRLVTVGAGLFLRHIKCWLQDTRLILLLALMSPWSPELLPGMSRVCCSCQFPR